MFNNIIIKMLNIVECFLRFLCLLIIFEEVFSFFTTKENLVQSFINDSNYIALIIYIVVFVISIIWIFKGTFENIIKKIYKTDNIKNLKKIYFFINFVRIVSITVFISCISLFCFSIYYENRELGTIRNLEFKINKCDINLKIKYKNNFLYYAITINNFRYPNSDFLARTVITFIDSDGFEIEKKEIRLREYTKINNSIEFTSRIPMSKNNYRNIEKVSFKYINPTDSIKSFSKLINNINSKSNYMDMP